MYERMIFAGLISFKALTSLTVIVIMLGTQPLHEYLNGLAHLRLPSLFITALFLAYRYVFLLGDELKNTQKALVSRGFSPGTDKKTLLPVGKWRVVCW